ncbi:MAG: YgjV family protein [Clostridia bacterium]|nr:YgjV family protein [Clostridia bacterium]
MYLIITQVIGLLAAVIVIGSYQFKKNSSLIIVQTAGSFLFLLNYFMLGAYTGAFMNLACVARGLIFYGGDKTRKPFVLVALNLLLIVGAVFTWESALSLLPLLGMIAVTVGMYSDNGKYIRMAQLFISSPCWLIYNFASGTIGGVICEIFVICSAVISIIRYGFDGFEK